MHPIGLIITMALLGASLSAQSLQRPVPPPRVNPDLSVTYFVDVDAQAVSLADSVFATHPPGLPFTKGADGIWALTTPPYEPGTHEYGLVIDGVPTSILNGGNISDRLPGGWYPFDLLDVRGSVPLLHDVQRVPHGSVHIQTFRSELFNREVSCYVYTPPSYEGSDQKFPALYLLHGALQKESAWTRYGYADRIMDNLIAQGEAKEMIVVMPDTGTVDQGDQPLDLVVRYMMEEIIPMVEQKYRIDADSRSRFVAGVAAGSNRARELAFLYPETFSAVAIMSGGGLGNAAAPLQVSYPKLTNAAVFNAQVKFVYIALGEQDDHTAGVQTNVRRLKDQLDNLGITNTFRLTSGGFYWFNFRRYFAEFVKGL